MYKYCFKAQFIEKTFDAAILKPAVANAQDIFNLLPRKNRKNILVELDIASESLEIILLSSIPIARVNYLRCIQYFCKTLAKEAGMNTFITANRRLLIS